MESLKPQKTLVERTYDAILAAICDGSLAPGERLTQTDLAERLSVSRQPVISALAVLRRQGFITDLPGRGVAVAAVDADRIKAIYQVRAGIEPLAVKLATRRLSPSLHKRGGTIVARGRKAVAGGNFNAAVHADIAFHLFLYEASGNPLIAEIMEPHMQHLQRAMAEILRRPDLIEEVWREHAGILDAMADGDAGRAADRAHDHIISAGPDFVGHIAHARERAEP